MNSKDLIRLIENKYLNRKGILSATYAPTDIHLLSDLDDFIPFFLYYGELNFVKDQILKSKRLIHLSDLVMKNCRIVSYMNNEFIGGIARYYKMTLDGSVKPLLDRAMKGVKKLLTRDGVISSYHNISNQKTSSISAPISGGMIEVLIDNADLYPDLGEIAYDSLDMWISSESFERYGLFLSKYHIKSKLWNKIFFLTHMPIPLKVQNRIGVNFFMNGAWNNLVYHMPIGIKVQTAKDNTNMVFSLIEAFRKTNYRRYKDAINRWIKIFSEKMIKDGRVYRYWQLYGRPKFVELDHCFPVLEILCDTYAFVDLNKFYLKLAEEIITTCVNEIRWQIGLFPKMAGGKYNHLDIQTDFVVSFQRLYELTGKSEYAKMSDDLFQNILKYHYTENGFMTSIDSEGRVRNPKIEPKYNALLLKSYIIMEDKKFRIYDSDFNHSLMKDR